MEFLGKKLENPSFVERAPADVVAKEREKLAEFATRKQLLEDSLVKIRRLR
jgi:valyl-tRNA synthetase